MRHFTQLSAIQQVQMRDVVELEKQSFTGIRLNLNNFVSSLLINQISASQMAAYRQQELENLQQRVSDSEHAKTESEQEIAAC